MTAKLALIWILAIGLASCAAPPPPPMMMEAPAPIEQVCGPGSHLGQDGNCHQSRDHFVRECPANTHLGPEGTRCWPN